MKKYGIVSYNIHGNFTNYGSVLQSFALQKAIDKYFRGEAEALVLDYWPKVIIGRDQLNPLKCIPDPGEEFEGMVNDSMPAIIENYYKIQGFIADHYNLSKTAYDFHNFDQSKQNEQLDGYIVGSDAIWMIDFFGKDDGFWGDYDSMKSSDSIAYAVSFGESILSGEQLDFLNEKIRNFKAIGLRESRHFDFIKNHVSVNVERVVDPTLLLHVDDYSNVTSERLIDEPYILMYSRKYNPRMDEYANQMAEKYGCKIVEISLRSRNKDKHIMYYQAGIEEFLSLIKYSENVITNSLHASIFSIIFHKPISFFERENAGNKVKELFDQYGLQEMRVLPGAEPMIRKKHDYKKVDDLIEANRSNSIEFLRKALLTERL